MKSFLTPATGKIVEYPDHLSDLKPYLIEAPREVLESAILAVPVTGAVYSTNVGTVPVPPEGFGGGFLGNLVLIDPDTLEPYTLGA